MRREELEERLERIERLLEELAETLREVERLLEETRLETPIALSIAMGLSKSVLEAIEAARRVAPIIHRLRPDEITRAVILALADCEALSISEVYRRVRAIRGRASRSVVASRLRLLEEKGVVVNTGSEARPRYALRVCLDGVEVSR